MWKSGRHYCGMPLYKSMVSLILLIYISTLTGLACSSTLNRLNELPRELDEFVAEIEYTNLGTYPAKIKIDVLSDSLVKVRLSWEIEDTLQQDDWQISISPNFKPAFHWAPHLTPTDEYIIAQHVFRAPALIMASENKQITVIPDLDILQNGPTVPWYLDMDATHEKLILGLSNYTIREHVLFTRKSDATYPPGKLEFGFYIMTTESQAGKNPSLRCIFNKASA